MSDSVTGLGMTDEEFRKEHEVLPIGAVNDRIRQRKSGLRVIETQLGDMRVDGDSIIVGDDVLPYSDALPLYMGMPVSYINSCDVALRNANVSWWLNRMAEKDASLTVEDGQVISVDDPNKPVLTMDDIMLAVEGPIMPIASLYEVESLVRSTCVDICNRDLVEFKFGGGWQGGIRIVHPRSTKGERAPILHPYLRSLESSAPIAFPPVVKIRTEGRDAESVLKQVAREVDETVALLAEGARSFREVWDTVAQSPVRMTEQVMREHKVNRNTMRRVREQIESMQDNGELLSVGQLVKVLSSWSMSDGLSAATRRGLSESAGLYFLGEAEQHRCPTCLQIWDSGR